MNNNLKNFNLLLVNHSYKIFFFKVATLFISFILAPLLIDYLNPEIYGLWVTILSFSTWINFFDIGVGNGLRNLLVEPISNNNKIKIEELISTAFYSLLFIGIVLLCIFLILANIIDWNSIFNVSTEKIVNLNVIISIISFTFIFNFIFMLNDKIAFSYQLSSFSSARFFCFNIIMLLGITILINLSSSGSLKEVIYFYALSMVISHLIFSYFLFSHNNLKLPRFSSFSGSQLNDLLSLGVKFFIIQIAALIIFATDNIIISRIFGPSFVTPYSLTHKLFSLALFLHTIILTPLWSAFSKMFNDKNANWIISTFKKLGIFTIALYTILILIYTFNKEILFIWTGSHLFFNINTSFYICILIAVMIWNNNFAYFLNGIGSVNVQLITSVIGGAINIPVSIYLAKDLNMGPAGVALGSIFSLSFFAICAPIVSYINLRKLRK